MYLIQQALLRLVADLKDLQVHWALVGGFAVALYGEPRTTRDIDIALAVSDEAETNAAVLGLRMRGYRDHPDGAVLEHPGGRLATVRLMLALKVLAGRLKDIVEIQGIVLELKDPQELQVARETLALITERGFHRGKDLQEDFTRAIESAERDSR